MKANGLINENPETTVQLSNLILVFDNERISNIDLPLSIPRTDWTDCSDPFVLPICIQDWTGTHERYIFLRYYICYETTIEDFSFGLVNIRSDTNLDPNFGVLGFRWIQCQLNYIFIIPNAARYKILNFTFFRPDPRNDQLISYFKAQRQTKENQDLPSFRTVEEPST
mgnify:CR=1 FL=1